MVKGEFKCLGSTQHLKNKFGEGFVLTIKLKKTPLEERRLSLLENQKMNEKKILVEEFLAKQFSNAILKLIWNFSLNIYSFSLLFFLEKSITT